jgi:hypothetical protein
MSCLSLSNLDWHAEESQYGVLSKKANESLLIFPKGKLQAELNIHLSSSHATQDEASTDTTTIPSKNLSTI